MASAGPNAAGTGADDATIGTLAWANPTRVTADDASTSDAISIPISGGQTHYLDATQFGFSIPTDATITGILAEANGSVTGNPGDVLTNSVKLIKGGVISGTDLVDVSQWPTSDDGTFHSWGADGQMWGLTLSPTDVNATNFGFALSMKNTSGSLRSASMDFMRLTVFYTTGGGPPGGGIPETPPALWNAPQLPEFPQAAPPPLWNKASD